jgi:Uma2 family endonuclease
MSISLHSTSPTGLETEPDGPTFRLSLDQYSRMMQEEIFTEANQVELREGFLYSKNDTGETRLYQMNMTEYHRIVEAGILTIVDRVELLEGWLVAKMTKKPPHTIAKGSTRDALIGLAPPGWFVTTEDPVTTIDSEPEPDISVVRGTIRDYRDRAPGPADVALIVEVADASLARDRSIKKRLYARAGFPIYWLINLVHNRIEVYTEPTGPIAKPDYLVRRDFGPDEMIPLVIEGREIGLLAVRNLLA